MNGEEGSQKEKILDGSRESLLVSHMRIERKSYPELSAYLVSRASAIR